MTFESEAQRRFFHGLMSLPPAALRALAGEPMRSPEGYVMDTEVQVMVHISDLFGHSDWSRLGVHKARRAAESSSLIFQPRPEGALSVHDEVLRVKGGVVRIRVYRDLAATGPLPVIVYYHGGGFVIGSIRSHDGECRALALRTGAMVLSVDYRLAPEHPFPAAPDDGTAAYLWAAQNVAALGGDPARMMVAGDSAGGNIAAIVALDLRDHPQRPVFQCLIYPATDFTRSLPSHQYFKEGPFLTKRSIDWFLGNYLPPGADPTHPRLSPLFVKDLAGLPPALVVTAGFDPLRDEGRAYADALKAAGVPVEYKCHEGLIHGFFSMSAGPRVAGVAFNEIVASLRAAVARATSPG